MQELKDVLVHVRSLTADLSTCFTPWHQGKKEQNSGGRGLVCAGLKANTVPPLIKGKVVPSLGMCVYLGRELSTIFHERKQNGLLTALLHKAALSRMNSERTILKMVGFLFP